MRICLLLLVVCFTSVVLGEDFKTIKGKEYKDATVRRIDPDGIVLKSKSGISKVYFAELPEDVQRRFNYDPARAAQFTTATQTVISEHNAEIVAQKQAAAAEQRRKAGMQRQQQAEEEQRQAAEQRQIAEQQRAKALVREQQAAAERQRQAENKARVQQAAEIQFLRNRVNNLQNQNQAELEQPEINRPEISRPEISFSHIPTEP